MVMSMFDQLGTLLDIRAGLALACLSVTTMAVAVAVDGASAASRVTEFKLGNGLQVLVIPDHRAPVVTHMIWYRAGSADEPRGSSGIAHFLEHLMFKGTEEIPPGQFSKLIAREGGEDNAFTNNDVTAYFQRVAKDRLHFVMKMEADRMANLRLSEQDVETERKVILEERRMRVDNDPGSILQEQMMAALYSNHPYGIPIIGWEHEIEALAREDALAFYQRFYAPNNALLVVAGDVEPDEVKTIAEATYGKIAPNQSLNGRVRPQEPEHYAPVIVKLEDARAGRTTVQRYYLAPSYASAKPGEAEALDLLMRIAVQGSTGKLYKRLVVERKKAASAGGWYSDSGLDAGRLAFYAIAADSVLPEELDAEIGSVIEELKGTGVTQDELDRARNSYIAEFVYTSDSQSRMARHYAWRVALGMSVADVDEWPERLRKVTVEDIRNAARTYLVDKNSVTGILTPVPETTSSIAPAKAKSG
ncbi:MAG TPA: pitrilysin family protein [Methyloceanibacter sp.]